MDLLIACAWCGRVKLDEWLDADEAIRELRTYEWPESPRISHGICDDCFEEVDARRRGSASAKEAVA